MALRSLPKDPVQLAEEAPRLLQEARSPERRPPRNRWPLREPHNRNQQLHLCRQHHLARPLCKKP